MAKNWGNMRHDIRAFEHVIHNRFSFLIPLGALAAAGFLSLAGYWVMGAIASTLGQGQANVSPSTHLIGVIGMVLFGLGVTSATLSRCTRSSTARGLLIGGAVAFAIAVLLIGFGNGQLWGAFQSLARAETVDAEYFRFAAGKASLPLLGGWGLVVLGAVCVFAAEMFSKPCSPSLLPSARSALAVVAASGATFIFLVAGVWSTLLLRGLESGFAAPQIEPAAIAGGVSGVLNATFLIAIGIASCALACLSMALSTSRKPRQETLG